MFLVISLLNLMVLILCKAGGSDTTVYLCDTFKGVVKAGKHDNVYKGGEHADTSIQDVHNLMKGLEISNYQIISGIFPDESGDSLQSETFKLCHIDVDAYDSAKETFEWVWPKLICGGVVIFDDYGFAACEGVTTLVNELSTTVDDSLFLYNINGHGILVKTCH